MNCNAGDDLGRLCDVYAVVDAATTDGEKRRRAKVTRVFVPVFEQAQFLDSTSLLIGVF